MLLRISHGFGIGCDQNQEPNIALTLSLEGVVGHRMQIWISHGCAEKIAPEVPSILNNPQSLYEPILLLLLDRFGRLGEKGLAPWLDMINGIPTYVVNLTEGDAPAARRLQSAKFCKYQVEQNGELFCTVATIVERTGVVIAPTTAYSCNACAVLDRRLACTRFCHPEVYFGPGGRLPELRMAQCDLGRGEVGISLGLDYGPARCKPGANVCWEREVEFERPPDQEQHALALHELFEFVDARWTSAFRTPLLNSRRAVAFGKLAIPCQNSADLEAKLNSLAHIMKGFEVPEELLNDEHRGQEQYKAGNKLNRMESALERKLAEDPSTIAVAKEAIAVLRYANGLRNDAVHGVRDIASRYARFELPYPPPAAPETWARIHARIARALHELADAMADL